MAIVLRFPGDAAKFYRLGFVQFIDAKRDDCLLRWDRARLQLFNLLRIAPKARLYAVCAELVALCHNNPPGESRDGVFVFKTK